MAYEQRDNSGTLFKNDRKTKDTQPDSTGTAMIGGKMYRLSGWRKTTKDGATILGLSFTPAEEAAATPRVPGSAKTPIDLDDEIPF